MHPSSGHLLAERTTRTDLIVQQLSARCLTGGPQGVPYSVVAVGGYGRSELFPQSDVDLLLLVEDESAVSALKNPLANLLRELWDGGLHASHSVRTISECVSLHDQNIELHISLLDNRFVVGDHELYEKLSRRLPDFFKKHETRLSRELADMARSRHAKFNQTVYHLEPNIKEAPGGIRDMHLLHWLALLSVENSVAFEAVQDVQNSRAFLYDLRCFLHQRSQRDNNLLSFELQDRAAEAWSPLSGPPLDPGEWMRDYYRHARRVSHAALKALDFVDTKALSLVRQFRDRRARLSTVSFKVSQDRVLLRNPSVTMRSAVELLELFTFVSRHGLHLSSDTHRWLLQNTEALQAMLREHKIPWPVWHDFLSQPNVALALREMQEAGLLRAAIPTWSAIECLVVRDFYHRYTVDEHSIVAVEMIDQLAAKANAGREPLQAEGIRAERIRTLLAEEDQLAILRLALLLHDVGKGTAPGHHVSGSIDAAEPVFEHLGVPDVDRETIRFLIRHHLDLSLVMTGRDVEDPATARDLTSQVGTLENLRRLTLLTFADISAVNPTAMTEWRLEQLWRVYLSAQEQLTRELISDRIGLNPSSDNRNLSEPDMEAFLHGFPTRYLRTHSAEQIQRHFQLAKMKEFIGVAVEVTQDSGSYLLTVVADDQPGRFASLCGALASFGMNILKAEAASNSQGCILDMIRFADPMRTLELNPEEVITLKRTVRSVVEGTCKVTDLLKSRMPVSRPSSGASISPVFRFHNEASDRCTLIDFVGEDRPGLLYDLTSALSDAGCNIELVLVDTEAHKAMDVFYVTAANEKLDAAAQDRLCSALMKAARLN